MKDYYDASDVMKITGNGQSFAYDLIKKLKDKFEEEFPNAISIQGKIPIWYFEKIMMNKEGKNYEENKKD